MADEPKRRTVPFLAAVSILPLLACSHEKPIDVEQSIGWVHGNCLAIKNSTLVEGVQVTLISLDGQQTTRDVHIQGKANEEAGCPALLEDRVKINRAQARTFYELDPPAADNEQLAVAILTDRLPAPSDPKVFQVDLDGDGRSDVVSSCDSSDGMKFSLWSGAVNTGKLLWSDYYYLGYDLTPTCPP